MSSKLNTRELTVVPTGADIELEISTSPRQRTADDASHTDSPETAEHATDPNGTGHSRRSKLRTATVMVALCVSEFRCIPHFYTTRSFTSPRYNQKFASLTNCQKVDPIYCSTQQHNCGHRSPYYMRRPQICIRLCLD